MRLENGYGTEAKKSLDFAFNKLDLDKVISICSKKNTQSENVMKKNQNGKVGEFKHSKIKEKPDTKDVSVMK